MAEVINNEVLGVVVAFPKQQEKEDAANETVAAEADTHSVSNDAANAEMNGFAEDALTNTCLELKFARELGKLLQNTLNKNNKKPGFIPTVLLRSDKLYIGFEEAFSYGWSSWHEACDDLIAVLKKSNIEFSQLNNIHGTLEFADSDILKLAKLCNLNEEEIENLLVQNQFANERIKRYW